MTICLLFDAVRQYILIVEFIFSILSDLFGKGEWQEWKRQ